MVQKNISNDEAKLESLGYKPELRREFNAFQVFSVAFSIMGLVPSLCSTIFYSLPYGGPIAVIWGWVIASVFITFIGLGLSDLASSMPTSGGLYFWTYKLGPRKFRNLLSWLVGYNSLLGNLTASASLAWGCAGQIFSAVSIMNPDFSASAAETFGLFCGILIFCGVYCAYFTPVFAKLGTASVVLNLILALVTIVGLPIAKRGSLNTAGFTFGGWENVSGWNNGFSFFLSWLAPVWTICSFDSAVSISEEASNASTAVPMAMTGAIVSSGFIGALILISFTLCIGTDIDAVVNNPQGNAFAYVYTDAFGKNGALVVWIFICIAQLSMTASVVFPASRQAWAFSRDRGLPFSKWLSHVDTRTQTPVRTVWLIVACSIPLGLLAFADPVNYAAINAIFALASIGLYVAYGIPIATRLIWGQEVFRPGPWYLGRFSVVNGWIAIVFMIFVSIVLCFPAEPDFDAGSMNYACLVLGAVNVLALAYYLFPKYGGKTFFTGPRTMDFLDYGMQGGEAETMGVEGVDVEGDQKMKADRRDGTESPVEVRPAELDE